MSMLCPAPNDTAQELRQIKFCSAIHEALDEALEKDPSTYLMGLGVPDPKAIFGTTAGLQEKYGEQRVFDMPVSENAMTGIAIGSAIAGRRPILTHQRLDFMLLSLDQIINNAAKWSYMFDGQMQVPLTIRALIGRGWGQGPQHAQNLASIFAHIPGLKVIAPATPQDAKSLLAAAINDNNPVICLEHRWCYNITGPVKNTPAQIGEALVRREGEDISIVTSSHMVLEALKAAEFLAQQGIQAEVVDLRSLRPLDTQTIATSCQKTGRLLAVDGAWSLAGIASEVIAGVAEKGISLKSPPQRLCFPEVPTPTSWALAKEFYPRAVDIARATSSMLGTKLKDLDHLAKGTPDTLDTPDLSFTGPF